MAGSAGVGFESASTLAGASAIGDGAALAGADATLTGAYLART